MTKDEYGRYRGSPHWLKLAQATRLDRHWICEDCGGRGWEVHHLCYERLGAEWPEDLILLCRDCHEKRHQKGITQIEKEIYEWVCK